MRLLLDTCVFLWLVQEPDQLSERCREAIDDPKNELCLSHASVWEMYLKNQSGKLKLPARPDKWLREQLAQWVVKEVPISMEALGETNRLPKHHRDPFDRLLVAQTRTEDLTLLTPDPWIQRYKVSWVW